MKIEMNTDTGGRRNEARSPLTRDEVQVITCKGLEDPSLKRLNLVFLLLFLVTVLAMLAAALGLFQELPETSPGIPSSILYLGSCALGFCLLTVVGYLLVFHRWSTALESEGASS